MSICFFCGYLASTIHVYEIEGGLFHALTCDACDEPRTKGDGYVYSRPLTEEDLERLEAAAETASITD